MIEFIKNNPAYPKQRKAKILTDFVTNYDEAASEKVDKMVSQIEEKEFNYLEKHNEQSILKKISYYLNISNPIEGIFLITFGITASFIIIIIDNAITLTFDFRQLISGNSGILSYFIYLFSSIILAIIATSVGLISKEADGSSIPELKIILTGISNINFFSFSTFVAKVIGLISVISSGLPLGTVGPYVHICCIICKQLLELNCFERIRTSISSQNNVILTASTVGITLALGTPLGGVLFSLETSINIYIVSNFWRNFFVSIVTHVSANIFKFIVGIGVSKLQADYTTPFLLNFDYLLVILLAVLCGILAALLNFSVLAVFTWRKNSWFSNRYKYILLVAIICSITFFYKPLRTDSKKVLTSLFYPIEKPYIDNDKLMSGLYNDIEGMGLLINFIILFICISLSLAANGVMDMFGPYFLIGALFGRIYGHLLHLVTKTKGENFYALIGAAAMTSGGFHTVSCGIILFELSGQTTYIVPSLLSCVISSLISQFICTGISDIFLMMKGLPNPSLVNNKILEELSANDIYSNINFFLKYKKEEIQEEVIVTSSSKTSELDEDEYDEKEKNGSFGSNNSFGIKSKKKENIFNNKKSKKIEIKDYDIGKQGFSKSFKEDLNEFNFISSLILFFKLPNNYKLPIPILDTQRRLLFTVKVKNLFTTLLNIFENADLNINLREQIEEILIYYQERFNFKEKSLSRKIFGNLKDFYNKMCNYQNWEMKKYLLEEKIQKNIFDLIELSKNPKKGQFLVTKLEEDNKFLDCDYSSITVEKNFPVIKMSLILNMLNIEQIFVSDDGILEGCVIKEDFLKKSLSLG